MSQTFTKTTWLKLTKELTKLNQKHTMPKVTCLTFQELTLVTAMERVALPFLPLTLQSTQLMWLNLVKTAKKQAGLSRSLWWTGWSNKPTKLTDEMILWLLWPTTPLSHTSTTRKNSCLIISSATGTCLTKVTTHLLMAKPRWKFLPTMASTSSLPDTSTTMTFLPLQLVKATPFTTSRLGLRSAIQALFVTWPLSTISIVKTPVKLLFQKWIQSELLNTLTRTDRFNWWKTM